jgi:hypothetical protein
MFMSSTVACPALLSRHLGRLRAPQSRPVEYIRSTFLPESAECRCLFRAQDIASVRELNDAAGLPFERIVPAMDLNP